MTGVEFLHRARDLFPHTLRMVLSGFTELQSIIDAVNEGAIYKFLTKPWDDERLRGHIAEAFKQKELADENRHLARQVDSANADLAALNERLERTLGQQRAQADLLVASTASLQGRFDELPIAVLGLDADNTLVFLNHAAEMLLPHLGGLLGLILHDELPSALLADPSHRAPRCLPVSLAGRAYEARIQAMADAPAPSSRLMLFVPLNPGH